MGNDCKKIILNARDSITLDINEPIELNRKRSISMNSTVYSKKFHNVIYHHFMSKNLILNIILFFFNYYFIKVIVFLK